MKKVAIVGGGVTGLAAAYSISKAIDAGADLDYIVLEKDQRFGGKIMTVRTDDGYVIEGGPDCFVSTKPQIFELAKQLGFEERFICSNDELKKTYILADKKLREMPDGLMMMVPTKILPFITTDLFTWPGKIRMAMDLVIPKKKEPGDETLASFVTRRLGREALDRIAEPLVAGIHAGDPDTMSLEATFPNFLEMEQNYGSMIRGMLASRKAQMSASKKAQADAPSDKPRPKRTFFMTFKGGMLDLIDVLVKALDKDKIVKGAEVKSIDEVKGANGQTSYKLIMADGATIEADAVILASPANSSGNLVRSVDSQMADVLTEIPQVSSATVTMAFRTKDLKHDLKGFGFVVPSVEGRNIMATTWSSSKWSYRAPDGEHAIIRAFVGGAKAQEKAFMSDDEMKAAVRAELKDILGIDAEPIHTWIFRWPNGMPQYTTGHMDRVNKIDERMAEHPGLYLAGGSYRGVGVPDCVASGTKSAESAVLYLAGVAEPAVV
ncbi:MAG TPA: protoporphyrinogen oxidase [Candidatus Aquicultor sp.]|jgi:oxygen-dependent protoporphyrinogen oxidase